MFQAPFNNIIVKPKTKYVKHISDLLKIASIENGSSVDPVDYVNIVGEVISIPKEISKDKYHEGYSLDNIRVGDTAIFRFDVIYDLVQVEPDAEPIYRNRMMFRGEEYFVCDIVKLFGVIRDGEIIMLNGYAMITDVVVSNLILPASLKKIKGANKAQLQHIGYNKPNEVRAEVSQGEWVYFSPLKVQKYEIANKKFCIIRQNQILGKSAV